LAYLDDKTSEIKADEKQLVIHLKELSTMQKTLNERYQKIAENKIIEIMTNIKVYLIISILFFLIISLVISLIIARQIHNKIFSIATGIENLAITNLSSIRAIQGAFDQLEATFSSQISEVHNSASAVEEITTTIEKNITSVNVSSQFAIASQKKTSEGRSNISQLIELSNQIDGDLENFKETIQQGNSETRKIITLLSQISKKTILIDEIVFQTKLLAFNASVEAARAGEHGKGFSVVAEEIGKLAHSSGEIAKDITEIVSKSVIDTEQIILETTKNISGLVDHTKQTTAKGKVQANISGQTLAEISENTLKVSEMLSSFALGSGEQSIGINSISKSIYKVDELSQKSLIQIQNTAGSIHSLQSSGKELEESSQNLLLILRKKEVS
jgi:methyl-accepting chemotaxis protein